MLALVYMPRNHIMAPEHQKRTALQPVSLRQRDVKKHTEGRAACFFGPERHATQAWSTCTSLPGWCCCNIGEHKASERHRALEPRTRVKARNPKHQPLLLTQVFVSRKFSHSELRASRATKRPDSQTPDVKGINPRASLETPPLDGFLLSLVTSSCLGGLRVPTCPDPSRVRNCEQGHRLVQSCQAPRHFLVLLQRRDKVGSHGQFLLVGRNDNEDLTQSA